MTPQILLTSAIILTAVVLFATEKLRVDMIALLVLLTVALTGLVTPEQAYSGFASPAVITVWAVYIVSEGLFRTGVADWLGERIIKLAGENEARLIAVIMLASGTMSAFMNNIGAAAVLLPAVAGIARRAGVPLSRLLIPLSFASLMGGNMTLIGTPPNILAASILEERGYRGFEFFDFTPTGAIVFLTGVIYMVLIGRHLLPKRENAGDDQLKQLREYISELRVLPESPLAGKTLAETRLGSNFDLTVLAIRRAGVMWRQPNQYTRLQADDLLFVQAEADSLLEARDELGLAIAAEPDLAIEELGSEEVHLVEAALAPGSSLQGRSLRSARFGERTGFTALAIWRRGAALSQRLSDVRLQYGDALLLTGPKYRLRELLESSDFLLLEPAAMEVRRRNRAWIAVGVMALVLGLATMAGLHISTALVIGSVAMILTGCLTMDEAYQAIEWRSVFLIAGMLPLGLAMDNTGTARYLAEGLVKVLGSYGPLAVLAGIYIMAGLITEPMSNAAATVLMVPIAIDVAVELGASPHAFVLATVIGASTSFLTPVGHQANVLVFGPGGYKFFDYTRVGWLLNIAILIATLVCLPVIWPLFP